MCDDVIEIRGSQGKDAASTVLFEAIFSPLNIIAKKNSG